jgi:hypothetical protein
MDKEKNNNTFDQPEEKMRIGNDGFGFDENSTYKKSEVYDQPSVREENQWEAISEFEDQMIKHLTANLNPKAHTDTFTWQEIVNAVFNQQKP